MKTTSTNWSIWKKLSLSSLICGIVTLLLGFHKMLIYENGEYSFSRHVNAYVGGDAYNYIINGTYATAFFVLTAMFVLAAIGLMILHYVSMQNAIPPQSIHKTLVEDIESNLPEL